MLHVGAGVREVLEGEEVCKGVSQVGHQGEARQCRSKAGNMAQLHLGVCSRPFRTNPQLLIGAMYLLLLFRALLAIQMSFYAFVELRTQTTSTALADGGVQAQIPRACSDGLCGVRDTVPRPPKQPRLYSKPWPQHPPGRLCHLRARSSSPPPPLRSVSVRSASVLESF